MNVRVCVCLCYVILVESLEGLRDDNRLCEVDPGAWTSTDDTGEHAM